MNKTDDPRFNYLCYRPCVNRVEQESNGYWVYLNPGHNFEGCGAIHRDTYEECRADLDSVEAGNPH
jgi:hypothetical protein